jgi:hypothetical protein
MGVGPQPLVKVCLGDRSGPLADQGVEKVEDFGRHRHRLTRSHQLPRVRIEDAIAEAKPHRDDAPCLWRNLTAATLIEKVGVGATSPHRRAHPSPG